jgi:hypothetical protein
MEKQIVLNDITNPAELKRLCDYLRELFIFSDVLYTETAPNGVISERRGKLALYYNGTNFSTWINVDGSTTWKQTNTIFGVPPDYSEFEVDGTLKFNGAATVFNDLYLDISPKTTGASKPTLTAFSGNINKLTFALNDITEVNTTEITHDWKEGSPIELHMHWASNGVDGTNRYVKWEIDYTWANILSAGGQTAFPTYTRVSAETIIPANTPDKTHFYTSLGSFTPTGGKIGSALLMSLKRIAASGSAPSSNPWGLMVGVHYEIDTIGSRSVTGK